MLCQCCGKNTATTSIKIIAGGRLAEYALCPECAMQLGCGNFFALFGYGEFAGGFFGVEKRREPRCPCCGATLSEIFRNGRVGCPECYTALRDSLLTLIRRIHGSDEHRGKRPGGSLPQVLPGGQLAVRGEGDTEANT